MPISPEIADERIGAWLSAALEDPNVCREMKKDIMDWFDSRVKENAKRN
jgi:hypothetical protein